MKKLCRYISHLGLCGKRKRDVIAESDILMHALKNGVRNNQQSSSHGYSHSNKFSNGNTNFFSSQYDLYSGKALNDVESRKIEQRCKQKSCSRQQYTKELIKLQNFQESGFTDTDISPVIKGQN